jgi:RimJ/RimL family protein N-acetyltransferase
MESDAPVVRVRIEAWSEGDLDLLQAANAPELMVHLGGPESEEQLLARHERYLGTGTGGGSGRMYRVVVADTGQAAGTIGFWEQTWQGVAVYETGWTVLPGHQGRGIATAATLAVTEVARAEGRHRYLHAFPKLENAPSNAVCRKAGFELMGAYASEYPPGNPITANCWRLDLRPAGTE